jgi:hypothetical protein
MKVGDWVRVKLTGRVGTIYRIVRGDGWTVCTVEYRGRPGGAPGELGTICSADDLEPP